MMNDITLNGLYNYDPSILTDLDLPEGLDEEQLCKERKWEVITH